MDLKRLEAGLKSGNRQEASLVISEAVHTQSEEVIPILIKYLNIADHVLRNEIAIALSDIGSQLAINPIIELLRDPKTVGNRGTLLYALRPFDISSHQELLVDFVIHGNFEVRHEAKYLLRLMDTQIPEESINKIKKAIDDYEDRIHFLFETLDELENGKATSH